MKFFQGGHRKDVGADCIGFVASVIDELYDLDLLSKAPRKSCFSKLLGVDQQKTVNYYINNWPGYLNEVSLGFPSLEVTPGDVIVCENPSGTGHLYLTGSAKNTVWHCEPGSGVQIAGIGDVKNVVYNFKMKDKYSWLKQRS